MILTTNPRKTTSVRDLGAVDVAALRAAVMAIPEATWNAENEKKPNRFSALDRTRHIVFRFVATTDDWRGSRDLALWAEWRTLLEPVLAAATRPYGYARAEFPRVMLARMAPGGVIHPHRDQNPSARWPHKIHVPLQTNDKVVFSIDGKGYHFPEGRAVEVNNIGVHAVTNGGETDRIHLIFEYFDADQAEPPWIEALRTQAPAF
jgi:hypothetical protein